MFSYIITNKYNKQYCLYLQVSEVFCLRCYIQESSNKLYYLKITKMTTNRYSIRLEFVEISIIGDWLSYIVGEGINSGPPHLNHTYLRCGLQHF